MERVKPITLTDNRNGKKYVLEFSRNTVRFAEGRGFNINTIGKKPMTDLSDLFYYAFLMHNPTMKQEETDEMIDKGFGGLNNIPAKVFKRLGELYNQAFVTLTDEEEKEIKANPRIAVEM
jgi:hypothetical protein